MDKINEFNQEFNVLICRRRYDEAFALCLGYMSEVENHDEIRRKLEFVIPMLKKRFYVPEELGISYIWLVEHLESKGYKKYRKLPGSLKWRTASIKVDFNEIGISLKFKHRVNVVLRILLGILLTCYLFLFTFFSVLSILEGAEGVDFPLWATVLMCGGGAALAILAITGFAKMCRPYKKVTQEIAEWVCESAVARLSGADPLTCSREQNALREKYAAAKRKLTATKIILYILLILNIVLTVIFRSQIVDLQSPW